MSNMSYCMFENTLADLTDCAEKLELIGFDISELSDYERKAAEEIINLCKDIARAFEDE